MIVENGNVKYMNLKELRKILETQKDPKMVVEKETEKALSILQEQLRSEKLKKATIFYHLYLHIMLIIQTCFKK